MTRLITDLTVDNQFSLVETLCSIYKKDGKTLEDAKLDEKFDALKSKNDAMNLASHKQALSFKLDEKDFVRDDYTKRFFCVLEGSACLLDEEEASAAKVVLEKTKQYGRSMTRVSFAEQTSLTDSMIKDLEESEANAALKKVHGALSLFEAIKTSEEDFKSVYAKSSVAMADAKGDKAACELKKEIREFFNSEIVSYIDAMCVVDKDKYSLLSLHLSEEISKQNSAARQNRASQKKGA